MQFKKKMLPKIAMTMLSASMLLGQALGADSGAGTPAPSVWDGASNYSEDDEGMKYWMADLKDGTGSLALEYKYKDESEPIEGAVIGLTLVADLTVNYGAAKYTILPEYSKYFPDISFEGMNSDEMAEFAREAAGYITDVDYIGTTSEWGRVKFTGLKYGLYIVTEPGKSGTAAGFADFTPFAVNVPFPQLDVTKYKGEWEYDVQVKPKTEMIRETPTPTITPPGGTQTGDDTRDVETVAIIGISAFLLAGLIAIIRIARDSKKKDSF